MRERKAYDAAELRARTDAPVDELPLWSTPARLGTTFDAARDLLRTKCFTAKVLDLMLDGEWHTVDQVRAVGSQQGDRRLRLLRQLGFTIESERDPNAAANSGLWRYRLVNPTPELIANALDSLSNARSATKALKDAEAKRGAA